MATTDLVTLTLAASGYPSVEDGIWVVPGLEDLGSVTVRPAGTGEDGRDSYSVVGPKALVLTWLMAEYDPNLVDDLTRAVQLLTFS